MKHDRKSERGSVMIYTMIGLTAFLGLAALATETGRAWHVKNELQAAADSASLAGVGNLLSNNFQTVDEAAARSAAVAMGEQHRTLNATIAVANADVEVGSWDLASRTFTALPGSTDPDQVRAVRTITRRDDTLNGPMPTILGEVVGISSLSVNTDAVGYWGFAGGAGPGVVDLPIAIDCCAISGDTPGSVCTQNYCQTVQSQPPNPCPLSDGTTASCLEFHSTPDQNSCWTTFGEDQPAISTNDMRSIISTGNQFEISGNPIYIDNGTKTPVISDIYDRFHGEGAFTGNASGSDTNGDGTVDSWVTVLPVVECQNPGDGCAGGSPADIAGFVCFDVHEVEVTPNKLIKGDFICPADPRCSNGGLSPGGSLPGGLSAQYPVLVQ